MMLLSADLARAIFLQFFRVSYGVFRIVTERWKWPLVTPFVFRVLFS